jgi:hypothetical protein
MKKDIAISLLFALMVLLFIIPGLVQSEGKKSVEEYGSIRIHFCIIENCTDIIISELKGSVDIACAFYTLRHPPLIELLHEKEARLVLHEKTNTKMDRAATIRTVKAPKLWGLMHNKFCTYTNDDRKYVITGSYNPSGPEKKHDMLIVISSNSLHKEYYDEFHEMKKGVFAGGKRTITQHIALNTMIGGSDYEIIITPAFCPEDNCEKRILGEMENARSSITMLAYTFTSEPIGDAMIQAHEKGVRVTIISDRGSRSTQGSQIPRMESHNITVRVAPGFMMHHKTIIIDDTIITGSMNYGKNANTRNDENILIINDPQRLIVEHIESHISTI